MSPCVQSANIALPRHSHVPLCRISKHCIPQTLTFPSVYNKQTLHSPYTHMSLCVHSAQIAFPRHSHVPLCTISRHCIPHTLTRPSVYNQYTLQSPHTHMSLCVQFAHPQRICLYNLYHISVFQYGTVIVLQLISVTEKVQLKTRNYLPCVDSTVN